MSIYKSVGKVAMFSGIAAGVVLATPASAFAQESDSSGSDAPLPLAGENAGFTDHTRPASDNSGLPDPGPRFQAPKLHDGWVEFGDSRPSTTDSQAPRHGTDSPPPRRADAGYIPRLGAGVKPSDADARWSYDFKSVADTGAATGKVPVPYPPISNVVPGDLGVVDNQAFHLKEDNRTADGPRRETTVSDPGWNLTTTDVVVPGAGRVYRFDMVCPDHAGHAAQGHHAHDAGQHDDVYTGASDFNLSKGHQVFSYHWGDPLFNDLFILAHYLAYGLSNTPPSDRHATHNR
jgi:hypothetical protein